MVFAVRTKQKPDINGNKPAKGRKTENDRVQSEKCCKLARGVILKWCKTKGA